MGPGTRRGFNLSHTPEGAPILAKCARARPRFHGWRGRPIMPTQGRSEESNLGMTRRYADPRAAGHLLILVILASSTLPFAAKAFHIDDVYFMEVAENVVQDPLRPFAGAVALEDRDYRVFDATGQCPSTF